MIRIFSHYVSKIGLVLLLMESLILLCAAMLSAERIQSGAFSPDRADNLTASALAFALILVLSMGALGMYQQRCGAGLMDTLRNTVLRMMPSFLLGFGLLSLLLYAVPAMHLAPVSSLIFLLGAAGVLLSRLVILKSAQSTMLEGRIMLVGGGALARECIELATSQRTFHRFTVVGCVPVAGERICVPAARLLPAGLSLLATARAYHADEIVVSINDRRSGAFPVGELLDCALGGVRVTDAAAFFEREACQIRVDSLQPSYLIFGGGFDQSFLRAAVKRAFDLLASGAICLVSVPLMLATALCIRLEDGGPVLYQQERVGKDGKPFKVLKFRSMRCDAEVDGEPRWAATDDPRVTRVGHLIRKLRIDELPQVLNVMMGDMSFVGPRPERSFFVQRLGQEVAYYNLRHAIKPGITGLAQVRYQYGASTEDAVRKLQYDLYYLKNNSLFLDLLILLDTVQVVLLGKGSR